MTDSYNSAHPSQDSNKALTETDRKKKLWKNLFLLNLFLTIVLVGFFWLPIKLVQMERFFNSPSVNLPEKGKVVNSGPSELKSTAPKNLLPTRIVTVNASSENDWAYFDFSRGAEVRIFDSTSLEWDLAFRRGKVISNGGATNKFGGAGLIDLKTNNFNSITEVPPENYIEDTATRTETENPVLLTWYKYNYFTHKLTAKKNVYAVRTADKKFAKVQFTSFYCDNKETGCIKMQYVYQDNGTNSFLKKAAGLTASVAAKPGETVDF